MILADMRSTYNLLTDCHADLRKLKSFFKICASLTKDYSANMQKELVKLGKLSDSFTLNNLMLLEYGKSFKSVFFNYEMQAMEFDKCHEQLKCFGNKFKEIKRSLNIEIYKAEATKKSEQIVSEKIVNSIKEIIMRQFESLNRFNSKLYSFNYLTGNNIEEASLRNYSEVDSLYYDFLNQLQSSSIDQITCKLKPNKDLLTTKEPLKMHLENSQKIHSSPVIDHKINEEDQYNQYSSLPLSQAIDARSISNTIKGLRNIKS